MSESSVKPWLQTPVLQKIVIKKKKKEMKVTSPGVDVEKRGPLHTIGKNVNVV
jgi:hypothetical protein